MTLLVTGAAGQLGREVVRVAGLNGNVVGLDRASLDITDRIAVREAMDAIRPESVINCGAWTDVDGCELDPERANTLNAQAVGHVAEASAGIGAHLVQISTDFVFNGEPIDGEFLPYLEGDPTAPLNVYGLSKLAGEAEAGTSATVVRTTWLQPADGPGMVGRILAGLAGDGPVELLGSRWACPTFVADLVPVLLRLAAERVVGVVHAVNAGSTSWADFGRVVAEVVGEDPERVVAVDDADLGPPRPARRPIWSALGCGVLRQLDFEPIRHHRDAVAATAARLTG